MPLSGINHLNQLSNADIERSPDCTNDASCTDVQTLDKTRADNVDLLADVHENGPTAAVVVEVNTIWVLVIEGLAVSRRIEADFSRLAGWVNRDRLDLASVDESKDTRLATEVDWNISQDDTTWCSLYVQTC